MYYISALSWRQLAPDADAGHLDGVQLSNETIDGLDLEPWSQEWQRSWIVC